MVPLIMGCCTGTPHHGGHQSESWEQLRTACSTVEPRMKDSTKFNDIHSQHLLAHAH